MGENKVSLRVRNPANGELKMGKLVLLCHVFWLKGGLCGQESRKLGCTCRILAKAGQDRAHISGQAGHSHFLDCVISAF